MVADKPEPKDAGPAEECLQENGRHGRYGRYDVTLNLQNSF